MNQNEQLRDKFKDETKKNLWTEDLADSANFSDDYVKWLEFKVLLQSEQMQSLKDLNNKLQDDLDKTNRQLTISNNSWEGQNKRFLEYIDKLKELLDLKDKEIKELKTTIEGLYEDKAGADI